MSNNARVIPFNTDEREERKEESKGGGTSYQNFMKKRDQNRANLGRNNAPKDFETRLAIG